MKRSGIIEGFKAVPRMWTVFANSNMGKKVGKKRESKKKNMGMLGRKYKQTNTKPTNFHSLLNNLQLNLATRVFTKCKLPKSKIQLLLGVIFAYSQHNYDFPKSPRLKIRRQFRQSWGQSTTNQTNTKTKHFLPLLINFQVNLT